MHAHLAWCAKHLLHKDVCSYIQANQHLQYLQCGYCGGNCFRHINAKCFQCIIAVHERMNKVVHGPCPAIKATIARKIRKAADNGHCMMKPVQKGKLLLTQYDKRCVTKLNYLAPDKQPAPEYQCWLMTKAVIAGSCPKTILIQLTKKLRQHVICAKHAEQPKRSAPEAKRSTQLKWLTITHKLHTNRNRKHIHQRYRYADCPISFMPFLPIHLIPIAIYKAFASQESTKAIIFCLKN